MRYCFNHLVQDFCPLKIEISQFPDGFPLKNNGKLKRVWRSLRGSNNKAWDVGWGKLVFWVTVTAHAGRRQLKRSGRINGVPLLPYY